MKIAWTSSLRTASLWTASFLLSAAIAAGQTQQASKTADRLHELANQAKNSGDLQGEANYLCQAAELDGKKYGKKCDKAKTDLAKTLAQFEADLGMGRTELQRGDYPGALRDLGKIAFGPHKEEAQELMQRTRTPNNGAPVDQISQKALAEARQDYARGDFDAAEALLGKVESQSLLPAAKQLHTDISIYRATMKEADAMASAGNFKAAAEKYQFAATIQPKGPGQPLEHLREVQAEQAKADQEKEDEAKAQQALLQQAQSSPPGKAAPLPRASHPPKAKNPPHDAHQDEAQGDPETLEDNLTKGIQDFYDSQFTQAEDAINVYLQEGGKEHVGVAHFYLGASLFSQAVLGDPAHPANADALRQQAREQFALARQFHYAPLHTAVSPKILAQWTQTGDQQ